MRRPRSARRRRRRKGDAPKMPPEAMARAGWSS